MVFASLSSLLFKAALFAATLGSPMLHAQAVRPRHAPRQVKQQIADLEEQWRAATLVSDTAVMDRLLSEDYVGISWNGQVNTKAMQLNRVRTHSFQITRLALSDLKVKVVNSIAIVTSTAELTGINDGAPMDGTFRYTRIYQRLPSGAWKITNSESTRVPTGHRHHSPRENPS